MESFAALLTGVLMAVFGWHLAVGVRGEAKKTGGTLLGTLPQRRPTILQVFWWIVGSLWLLAVALGFAFGMMTDVVPSLVMLYSGFIPLWGVLVAHLRSRDLELRECGLILPRRRRPFVPWKDVFYLQRRECGRELLVRCVEGDVTLKTDPAQVEAVLPLLLPRVRVRDETGKMVNRDRELLNVDVPQENPASRYQFRLQTLLLLMVVVSAVFAGQGIHLRARQKEEAAQARREAALAKYQRFGPAVNRIFHSVWSLDFSQCETSPADDDLVYVKDLPDLQYLNLSGSRITDAGLVHLESLKQLRHVWLSRTQVTDDGVRKLREALPDTKIYH